MSGSFPQRPVFKDNGMIVTADTSSGTTLSTYIEQAEEHSTIQIPPGTYTESLVITKQIVLAAQGDEPVYLQPSPGQNVLTLASSHCLIRGLTIQPSEDQGSSLVNFQSGTAVFEACNLSSPNLPAILTHSNGRLFFTGESTITTTEAAIAYLDEDVVVEFDNSTLEAHGSIGLVVSGHAKLRLSSSLLQKCGDSGILVRDDGTLFAQLSEFRENGGHAVELITKSKDNSIVSCTFDAHTAGAAVYCTGKGELVLQQSALSTCVGGIIAVEGFSVRCIDNEIGNMGAYPLVTVVESHVEFERDSLKGPCSLGISSTESVVALKSVSVSEIGSTAVTVKKNSKLSLTDCTISQIGGLAIDVEGESELTVSDCAFRDLQAIGVLVQGGGPAQVSKTKFEVVGIVAVHLVDNAAEITFNEVKFIKCQEGGCNVRNSTPQFSDCIWSENQGSGIVVRGFDTSPAFDRCKFEGNETGVTVCEAGSGTFNECEFLENGVAVAFHQAVGDLTDCKLIGNRDAAIWIDSGSHVTVTNGSVEENQALAIQIEGENTSAAFDTVDISRQKSNAVLVFGPAVAKLSGCSFEANEGIDVQVLEHAQVELTSCELSGSAGGVAVAVAGDQSFLRMKETVITDEGKAGVVVGSGGTVGLAACDISKCGVCGVLLKPGSAAEIKETKITEMDKVGIQVEGGYASIVGSTVKGCKQFGINVAPNVDPHIVGNTLTDNGLRDVNRE
jgi:nitrous oxidase accessory protein NosD